MVEDFLSYVWDELQITFLAEGGNTNKRILVVGKPSLQTKFKQSLHILKKGGLASRNLIPKMR